MNLFRKPLETVEIFEDAVTHRTGPTIKPPMFKFRTYDDFLFERILYIRDVLVNADRYTNAPDEDALNNELFRLLVEYEDAIGKKINMNVEED